MIVPSMNAFTINRLGTKTESGLDSMPFPLSAEVSTDQGVSGLHICAQRVVDLCDLLEKYAQDHLALFGVEAHKSHLFEGFLWKRFPLTDLATLARVGYSAIDQETIVLPKENLLPLLTTIGHYELSLFDIPGDCDEIQIIGQVLASKEHDQRRHEAVLPKLPESRFFLHCHDDCYLTVESHDPGLPKDIFGRTLQIYAGTALEMEPGSPFDIADFPRDLIDVFWKSDLGITMWRDRTQVESDGLLIGVDAPSWLSQRDADYEGQFLILYDAGCQQWSVEAWPEEQEEEH